MNNRYRQAKQAKRVAAIIAALSLLVTACGGGSAGSAPQETDGTATGGNEGGTDAVSGDPIVIGRLLPTTGGLADLGTRVSRGAEIARQMLNDSGGIDGRPVEWNTVDAPDDEAARQGAERLVNGGADIVYGTYGSSLALAAAPVVVRSGGIYWEEGASTEELTQQGWDGLFRVSATAKTLGVDAVNFAADVIAPELGTDPSALTVGWAGVESSYGQDVLSGVEQAAEEHSMEVVIDSSYPVDATDLSTVARQIQQAAPDILILTNYPPDAAALGRALQSANFEASAIIGTGGGHADPSWVEAMGDAGDGFFNVGTVPEINPSGLREDAQARQEEFVSRFEDEFGESPAGFDRMGFDGAWLLFEVIKEAGSTDPAAVKEAALATEMPERSLLSGDGVQFAENGQNQRVAWFISQWQDGQLVPVAPEDLALGEPTMIPLPPLGER